MRRFAAELLIALFATNTALAADAPPLSYLSSSGAKAHMILPLTWGVIGISIFVVCVLTLLTLIGALRRVDRSPDAIATAPHRIDATRWLYIGVGVSTLVLIASLVWTVQVLARTNRPGVEPALTIEVTGQQWWWKVRYLNDDPSKILTTANEIHIPVGKPVRVQLAAADVIHSFWVPQLSGKMDLIPGQTNVTWIQADKPGTYRGQCAEYCGVQHAHMGFTVVAESDADFQNWLTSQLAEAPVDESQPGAHTFESRCGACHTVRGTFAGGTTGPDLTHLLSRRSIAAETLANDPSARAAWMANPQVLKPGNHMPNLQLSSNELGELSTFLDTLH